MKKLNDLKAILAEIPEGKKINSTLIKELADLDFFRKDKKNLVIPKETVKIPFDQVFSYLFAVEKKIENNFEMGVKDLFNGYSDILIKSLKKEIGDKKFKKIRSLTVGSIEKDISVFDEPSEFVKYFVLKIEYEPETEFVKQTDSQVVEVLKSKLNQLRKSN